MAWGGDGFPSTPAGRFLRLICSPGDDATPTGHAMARDFQTAGVLAVPNQIAVQAKGPSRY
jgi:hypothetical protein